MPNLERQNEVQALSGPVIEEAVARLINAGLQPHEIAQAIIFTGVGMLAASLGPKHAGYQMRDVAKATHEWISDIAASLEAKAN